MIKKAILLIERKLNLLLRIVAILSILISLLYIMISVEMFSHGPVFSFLGFISILINLLGFIGGIWLLIRQKSQISAILIKSFSIIGVVFFILYSLVTNSFEWPLFGFSFLWIVIFIFLMTPPVKKLQSYYEPIHQNSHKTPIYLQLSWKLYLIIFGFILSFLIVWLIDWEDKANFRSEPNGSGISNVVQETSSPYLSVTVEGGFIYSLESNVTTYEMHSLFVNTTEEDYIGEIKMKLTSPQANMTLYAHETGLIRVNILNLLQNTEIKVNGKNYQVANHSIHLWKTDDDIENITMQMMGGRHLGISRGAYFDLDLSIGETYIIDIEPIIPEAQNDEFKFVVLSDLHSGYNIFSPEIININDFDPDMLIVNGDFTNFGFSSEYMMMASTIELLPYPTYTSIGNHDMWNDGGAVYNKYFGPSNYSFVYKNSLFIIMDTSSGIIGESQFEWLINRLEANTSEHIFVITHMPPIDTNTGEFDTSNTLHPESLFTIHSKSESDYFMRLMSEYHVDVVFAGHTHVHGMIDIDGTTYVTSGVLGGSVKPGNTIGYLEVNVNQDEVSVEFIDILSVEEATSNIVENYLQVFRVFLTPFLINHSIRIFISLCLIIGFNLALVYIRKNYLVVFEQNKGDES